MARIRLSNEPAVPIPALSDSGQRVTRSAIGVAVSTVLLAVPVALLVVLGYRQRWVSEDAYISLRVVEQILAGNGPVFNAGERIEAHTNPLWVGMLTLVGALGVDTVWSTVYLGILFSAAGLLGALAGSIYLSRRLTASDGETSMGLYFPAGAMVFIAVPVAWDFVTSGLETGLGYGWLGISFWLLVRCGVQSELPRWQWYGSALVLGLGPLVRPDFAIFSGGFLLSLAYLRFESHERTVVFRDFLWMMAFAAMLPVGYQIFRMGYYAALVPNTALAKEAGSSNWEQGRVYFNDFVDPYRLWIPLAIILGLCLLWLYRGVRGRDWPTVVLIAAPIITAALHAGYIVRVGGDFMHGRMLLPALFAIMMPLAAVRLPMSHRPRALAIYALVFCLIAWSAIAATSLRTPLGADVDEDTGLVDERAFYVDAAGHQNPITLDDYASNGLRWLEYGLDGRNRVENGSHAVLIRGNEYPISAVVPEEIRLVMPSGNIGIFGFAAGTSVHVVDRLGLADPIGARLELEERRRPGHEKTLPMVWIVARFTALGTDDVNSPDYPHALAVLECGEVAALIEATTAPLTPGRFVENIRSSWTFHSLRIPPEAGEARERFCQ